MPSKAAHVEAIRKNQTTLDYLLLDHEKHSQWIVTVAFHQCLHVVEAILAGDSAAEQKHTDDHGMRNRLLKGTRRYEKLYTHYRALFNDSLIARYLQNSSGSPAYAVFDSYLSPDKVRSLHVEHNRVQIIRTARTLLKDPDFLVDVLPHKKSPAT
jgi:hypothetical protein